MCWAMMPVRACFRQDGQLMKQGGCWGQMTLMIGHQRRWMETWFSEGMLRWGWSAVMMQRVRPMRRLGGHGGRGSTNCELSMGMSQGGLSLGENMHHRTSCFEKCGARQSRGCRTNLMNYQVGQRMQHQRATHLSFWDGSRSSSQERSTTGWQHGGAWIHRLTGRCRTGLRTASKYQYMRRLQGCDCEMGRWQGRIQRTSSDCCSSAW